MGNPSPELFPWSDQYQVGIDFVDKQHRVLVDIINNLQQSMLEGKGKVVIGKTLEELIVYTQAHFAAEEKVLDNCGYPEFPAHHGEHERLSYAVMVFHQKLMTNELGLSVNVMGFLKDWLGQHILNTDKKYGPFLKDKGIK
jgi:hemerythrin-like metal-binding protein